MRKLFNIYIILAFTLLISAYSFACNWCVDSDKKEMLQNLKSGNERFLSDRLECISESHTIKPNEGSDNLEVHRAKTQKIEDVSSNIRSINENQIAPSDYKMASAFYNEYLAKYYPKAFVITEEYLCSMCPVAAAIAIDEVLKMLSYKTYFYFQNKPKGFVLGHYLENIKEQLDIMVKFLHSANIINGKIHYTDMFEMLMFESNPSCERLIQHWKARRILSFYDFYAFYFDYLVKFFLEGIKFRLISQASNYYFELSKLFEKLKGSDYEPELNERLKIYKELLDLLKGEISKDSNLLE